MKITLEELKRWLDAELAKVTDSQLQVQAERNLLIGHFLHLSREAIILEPERCVDTLPGWDALQVALHQRVTERVPLQHLMGQASFYGLVFQVNADVLIPRPETELLVEQAELFVEDYGGRRILDLGTGSGCIAISLKIRCPDADVTAVDASERALLVASANAERLQAPVRFLEGAWFEPVQGERFDVIVSNPPYIAVSDKGTLTPEVLKEPEQALFAPSDPVDLYEYLLEQSLSHLNPRGGVFMELGIGLGGDVLSIAESMGYQAHLVQDYSGIDRILVAVISG